MCLQGPKQNPNREQRSLFLKSTPCYPGGAGYCLCVAQTGTFTWSVWFASKQLQQLQGKCYTLCTERSYRDLSALSLDLLPPSPLSAEDDVEAVKHPAALRNGWRLNSDIHFEQQIHSPERHAHKRHSLCRCCLWLCAYGGSVCVHEFACWVAGVRVRSPPRGSVRFTRSCTGCAFCVWTFDGKTSFRLQKKKQLVRRLCTFVCLRFFMLLLECLHICVSLHPDPFFILCFCPCVPGPVVWEPANNCGAQTTSLRNV